jgi:rubredoxin
VIAPGGQLCSTLIDLLAGSNPCAPVGLPDLVPHKCGMARKRRYDIPKATWTCPHCGFPHTAAELMRLDSNRFQCKSCGKSFPSGTAKDHNLPAHSGP